MTVTDALSRASARQMSSDTESISRQLPFFQWALWYARRGVAVLPLDGKAPRTTHGVKDASSDPAVVAGWWQRWPTANVGIAVGPGEVVVDVDTRHNGEALLLELAAGPLPRTRTARTGGGGWHLWFSDPDPAELRGRLGARSGVDLKKLGGYVVAPPSIHPDTGRAYRWVTDPRLELAQLPACLRRHGLRPQAPTVAPASPCRGDVSRRLQAWLAKRPPAVSGQHGHDHTFATALNVLRLADGDVDAAFAALRVWNLTCQPPWSERDLARKLQQAALSFGRTA
jgi:hypothetical protein